MNETHCSDFSKPQYIGTWLGVYLYCSVVGSRDRESGMDSGGLLSMKADGRGAAGKFQRPKGVGR